MYGSMLILTSNYEKRAFNASNIINMKAELGALRITVTPQPRYRPFKPYARYIAAPSAQNFAFGAVECTDEVCIRDFMVSAGKKRKLYDMPAVAPASACCHSGRGSRSGVEAIEEWEGVCEGEERALNLRNATVTVSLLPNQAAQPPVSRMRVPSCP